MLSEIHPSSEKAYLDFMLRLTSQEKLGLMRALTDIVVGVMRDFLARDNPGLSTEQLDLLWIEQQYGRELAENVRVYLEERRSKSTTEDFGPTE